MDPFYQIFYPYKKFESFNHEEDRIFDDFFLTMKNKTVWESTIILPNDEINIISTTSTCNSNKSNPDKNTLDSPICNDENKYIFPKQSDTLFWCLYIYKYGYDEYLNIHSKYDNQLLSEKMKIMEFIKSNKSKMKRSNYKLTNILIQQIMSEMMIYQSSTSLLCVIAMSIFYGITIYIFDEKRNIYLQFIPDASIVEEKNVIDTESVIIRRNGRNQYSLYDGTDKTAKISHIITTMICVEFYNKPLKPISHYKTTDLQTILEKMKNRHPSTETKLKKNELYEYISENCSWDL
jgi:hypothetical protein